MKSKPLIGITSAMEKGDNPFSYVLGRNYVKGIAKAGGNPVILPCFGEEDNIQDIAETLDGLLLSGGVDIDPLLFGEEPHPKVGRIDPVRDLYEKTLIDLIIERKKPILGICRGCQELNLFMGGSIFQDLDSQRDGELIKHIQNAPRWHPTHSISVENGFLLTKIYPDLKGKVNSFHHQAIKDPAPDFKISCFSPDGVVEAIEYQKDQFIIGVQWHPEHLWEGDPASLELFKIFVEETRRNMF